MLDVALFVRVADTQIETMFGRSSCDTDIIVRDKGSLEDFILPIGVGVPAGVIERVIFWLASCSLYSSLNCGPLTNFTLSTTFLKPKEVFILTKVCPSFAFLVVMMITPFAPRTPKMARDDGSFRISIDSISSGLRKLILSLNKPSTMYSGLYPLMEFVPRIRIPDRLRLVLSLQSAHLPLFPVRKKVGS